jgi:hypothetical protein
LTPAQRRNVMASRKLAQQRVLRLMQEQCANSVNEGSPPLPAQAKAPVSARGRQTNNEQTAIGEISWAHPRPGGVLFCAKRARSGNRTAKEKTKEVAKPAACQRNAG